MKKKRTYNFADLARIMDRLLSDKGCPWDRKQTHKSLLKYLYEEADETASAVRKKDWPNLREELGDVLLQVVFHAALAKRDGRFTLAQVVDGIAKKMVRRHPHVFGGKKHVDTAGKVLVQWAEIKAKEKARKKKKSA